MGPLFEDCVDTTNATLPKELRIDYREMDLSHLIKKEGRYHALFALKEHTARAIHKVRACARARPLFCANLC